jgi:hypothetical protein
MITISRIDFDIVRRIIVKILLINGVNPDEMGQFEEEHDGFIWLTEARNSLNFDFYDRWNDVKINIERCQLGLDKRCYLRAESAFMSIGTALTDLESFFAYVADDLKSTLTDKRIRKSGSKKLSKKKSFQ